MGTYTSHYISHDLGSESWSVYVEQYPTADHDEPIDGSQTWLSSWPSMEEASEEARRLQLLANK